MINKNKKGFLLGEFTLKVIVAVISLSLLIYLLFLIYGAFAGTGDAEKEAAASLLSTIIQKIGTEVMPKGSYQMVLTNPKGTLNFFKDGNGDCTRNCLCLTISKGGKTIVCKVADGVYIEKEIEIDKPVNLIITLNKHGSADFENDWTFDFTTD